MVPDSFDAYASHRPSGENAGRTSLNGVPRNSSAFPSLGCPESPSIGAVKMSSLPPFPFWVKARRLPSGENEYGSSSSLPSVRRCASPDPSERIQYRPGAAGVGGLEHDVLPVGSPHRIAILAWQETQPRGSVLVQILHPEVVALAAPIENASRLPSGEKRGVQ